ncbi:MAG TPA: hypothetical protein PLB97_07140 [Accumulibacter sp.]|mgnify:FL=1|nr:hypothetical protein [Accumulibacter sp.]HPP46064.1 hypothetical protein [Accumulibacter sp.]
MAARERAAAARSEGKSAAKSSTSSTVPANATSQPTTASTTSNETSQAEKTATNERLARNRQALNLFNINAGNSSKQANTPAVRITA